MRIPKPVQWKTPRFIRKFMDHITHDYDDGYKYPHSMVEDYDVWKEKELLDKD